MSEKKYLIFGERDLNGFGNKLQALVGWYVLAQLTGRQFVISNELLHKALQSNFHKNNFPSLSIGTTHPIVPPGLSPDGFKQYFDVDFPAIDFYSLNEQFLESGGGRPMLHEVSQNKYFKNDYRELVEANGGQERFVRGLYKEIFNGVTPDFNREAKKYFNFSEHKYSSVQFRTFFDSGPLQWSSLPLLDVFLDNLKKIKNEHIPPDSIVLTMQLSHNIYEHVFKKWIIHWTFAYHNGPSARVAGRGGPLIPAHMLIIQHKEEEAY